MPKLHLQPTKSTPEVILDPAAANCRIEGISTPINAFEFYDQIAQWLASHVDATPNPSTFTFHLPYFNSASMKALLLVFRELSRQIESGKKWNVIWVVENEDEFMADAAESFKQLLNFEIHIEEI